MPKSTATVATSRTNYRIHSVEKALDLLDAICAQGGDVRLSELSERLGLTKVNVFRLLATLESRGFVARGDDARKYRLGISAYEMGQKLMSGMGLMRKARPVMERLARECCESVYMVVPYEGKALILDMVDSCHQVKVAPMIGRRFSLHANSLGQIFLAWGQRDGWGEMVTNVPAELQDRVTSIRQLGYAEEENALEEGVASLGIPIFNARKQVVAVLAIIGPTFRIFAEQRRQELLQLLTDAGRALSTILGYFVPYFRGSYVS